MSILGKRTRTFVINNPRDNRRRVRRTLSSRRIPSLTTQGLAPLRTGGFFGVQSRRARDEKKVIDSQSQDSYNTDGTIILVNGVATGTDFTNRIGRKIFMKSIYIRGSVEAGVGQLGVQCIRTLLVYDMQSNGASPAITDILKTALSISQLNINNRDRFKVLWDKVWSIGPWGVTTGPPLVMQAIGNSGYVVKKFKRLNLETLFNGTTNAIGSIATGALFLVSIGEDANGGTNPFIAWTSRVRFSDA